MIYLLTITLVWAAGLALYLGLLKRVPAHGFNRAFLLTTLLGGLLVPFIPVWSGGPEALPALIRNAVIQLPEVVITAEGTQSVIAEASSTSWWMIAYLVGVAAAIGLFACSIYRLLQLFRKSKVVEKLSQPSGLIIRETGRPLAPFSFAKNLFVSDWDALEENEKQVLTKHESAHYTHFHTIDNVLASLVVVLAWFHPLAYVLRRELRLVHEFQADAHTLTDFDSRSYREILLRQQLGAPKLKLVAAFAQSPLKTRFAMMTNKFNKGQFWRLGAALLCLMLVVAACTKESIDDADLANLAEVNGDEMSKVFAEAAMSTDGMTLESVDTINVYDPEKYVKEVTVVERWVGPNNTSKTINKRLGVVDKDGNPINLRNAKDLVVRSQKVLKTADQMPRFPGCENFGGTNQELDQCATKKLLEFVYANIKYPTTAREKGVEGTAVVTFVVGTDGELLNTDVVRNPAIVSGLNDQTIIREFDDELTRLIKEMPAWEPGRQDGKDVQVQFNLPVKFRLQ